MGLIGAVGLLVGGVSSYMSSQQANKSAREEADMQQQQAQIAQNESIREAERVEKENVIFRKRQKLAFLKSGVTLEGSPGNLLLETKRLGEEEVVSILRSGTAQAGLLTRKAAITRGRGRSALLSGKLGLISGIAGAAGSIGSMGSSGGGTSISSSSATSQYQPITTSGYGTSQYQPISMMGG